MTKEGCLLLILNNVLETSRTIDPCLPAGRLHSADAPFRTRGRAFDDKKEVITVLS
jgi:hypothetical protein